MAREFTSFFTNCVSAVSPLRKPIGVLAPIEKEIAVFFDELKKGCPVLQEKINTIRTILSDFISDELLPAHDSDHLIQRAKQLQNNLIAVEYFSKRAATEELNAYLAVLKAYLRLLKINETPIVFPIAAETPKKSGTRKSISINTALCQEFLKTVQIKYQTFHHELKPLEIQLPLPRVMPHFEEKEDVYSFIDAFERRAARAVRLNEIKAELNSLEAGLQAYSGVADTSLRRLHDQCKQGLSSLLARVTALRADFGRQPLSLKKAISGPLHPQAPSEFFSKKPVNLTLS